MKIIIKTKKSNNSFRITISWGNYSNRRCSQFNYKSFRKATA